MCVYDGAGRGWCGEGCATFKCLVRVSFGEWTSRKEDEEAGEVQKNGRFGSASASPTGQGKWRARWREYNQWPSVVPLPGSRPQPSKP